MGANIDTTNQLQMMSEVTGTGRPLVLVPGGLTGWQSWERFVPGFARDRRVIRVQLVAVQYGLENRALPAGHSLRLESEALATALEPLDLGMFDLVAWSFGAAVSLDYALNHPERIRTLTLIEPPARWVLGTDPEADSEIAPLRKLGQEIGEDVSEDQLEQFACAVGLCPPGVSPRSTPQWPSWLRHRNSLKGTVTPPLEHRDDLARLAAFKRPVLLVKGTGSAPWLHKVITALAQRLPQAKVIELPGGHAPHLAASERFLAELQAFQDAAE